MHSAMPLSVQYALPVPNPRGSLLHLSCTATVSHLHERPEAEVHAVLAERHPPIAHLQHVGVWSEGERRRGGMEGYVGEGDGEKEMSEDCNTGSTGRVVRAR